MAKGKADKGGWVCLHTYMYVCLYISVCGGRCTNVWTHIWRLKCNLSCCSAGSIHRPLEKGLLSWPPFPRERSPTVLTTFPWRRVSYCPEEHCLAKKPYNSPVATFPVLTLKTWAAAPGFLCFVGFIGPNSGCCSWKTIYWTVYPAQR